MVSTNKPRGLRGVRFGIVCVASTLLVAASFGYAQEADAPKAGTTPTENPASNHWQHVRMDEVELSKLGDGSAEKGLNKLGAQGYSLFIVTSVAETSGAGFHYFKRPPWNKPGERPQVEYKRLDAAEISKLGGDSFNSGLSKLEEEDWILVAVTTSAKGAVGFHYFQRPKPEPKPTDAPEKKPN